MRQCVMRRLISVALGIVMIILAGCSFSVPVREEESTDSTVVIKADRERGHRAGKRDRNLCSRLWMCEEARGISFTFRCKNAGGD